MAQQLPRGSNTAEAYNFELFAPQPKAAPSRPNIRVVPGKKKKMRQQTKTLTGALVTVFLIAVLGAFVVATYAKVGELQSNIDKQNVQLTNETATYSDLIFQLESKTNLNRVEEQALAMGLVKIDKSQITYVRVVDENRIEVQNGPLAAFIEFVAGLFA